MKKLLHAAALAIAMLAASAPSYAQVPVAYQATVNNKVTTIPVTAANPLPITTAGGGTTVKATAVAPTFVEGSTSNQLSTDLAGGLRVSGSISATSAMKATAADPSYTEGTTTNPVSSDLAGYQRGIVKQSGTWTVQIGNTPNTTAIKVDGSAVTQPVSGNLTNISGTISLPTGAATLTAQTNVTGTKAAGTAAANSLLVGGVYNSGGITLTTGQQAALQFDSAGGLKVSGAGGGTQFAEDVAHTTGDLGTMSLAVRSDTAASTAGTTGDYQPLITDANGKLWTSASAVASSFVDGWDLTQGTKGDTAWTSGSGSVVALLKAIAGAAIDTTTPTPMKIDQTTDGTTNAVHLVAGTALVGKVGIDQTTPGTTNHVDAGLSAATTGGCTPYGLASAASNNSTNVKASAGTLCSVSAINTTATLYYLRLYNASSAPTCSSATNFVMTIPVPASATGAGVVVNTGSFGWAFSTGISFCLTSGGSSTDNGSAATGVYLSASYK